MFGLAATILLLGMVPIFLIKEPPGPPPRPASPFRHQMGEMAAILKSNRPFRQFVAGLSLVGFGTMATGFLMAYAVLELGASDEIAAWYTVTLLAASVLANSVLGWLADRHGFGAVGQASALAGAALAVLALFAGQPLWLLASFAFVGIGQAGSQLAIETGPMEFAPGRPSPQLRSALLWPCESGGRGGAVDRRRTGVSTRLWRALHDQCCVFDRRSGRAAQCLLARPPPGTVLNYGNNRRRFTIPESAPTGAYPCRSIWITRSSRRTTRKSPPAGLLESSDLNTKDPGDTLRP